MLKEKGRLSMAGQVVVTGSLIRGTLMAAGSLGEQRDMLTDRVANDAEPGAEAEKGVEDHGHGSKHLN